MIPYYFIFLSPILSLISGYFYIRDTIRGTTKPNRVSFFIWTVIPMISIVIALQEGAGLEMVPVFMAGFTPLLTFIVSFVNKNSYWRLQKMDYIAGMLSVAGIVFWLTIQSSVLALIFLINANFLAYLPTLIKSWTHPETETQISYILTALASIIGLLVIENWFFEAYAFLLYLVVANMCIFLVIYYRKVS